MLDSFVVQNFRSFRSIEVSRLGRVNLIVGKNCVGKTTLLEAIWLYAARMRPEALHNVLSSREEMLTEQDPDTRETEVDVPSLFHGRRFVPELGNKIVLGPLDAAHDKPRISLRMTWVERSPSSEPVPPSYVEIREEDAETATGEVLPALVVTEGENEYYIVRRYDSWFRQARRFAVRSLEFMPPFLRAGTTDDEVMGKWWDSVALTESERDVIEFLRLLVPVERVNLVESPASRSGKRLFVVKLEGQSGPQPLRSLGDGVERAFRTALALIYSKRRLEQAKAQGLPGVRTQDATGSILLVDEIDAGIHYTAIPTFWRNILRLAVDLDVQIFATTHSWDCVAGFQHASTLVPDARPMLVRIERRNGSARAISVDEEDLRIVVRDEVEIR